MYLWIPTPCLNAFWHGRPYILLHFWKCFYYFVEATGLSEFTNYVHILRSVPHNHDVATLVPSWQQCDIYIVVLLFMIKHSEVV